MDKPISYKDYFAVLRPRLGEREFRLVTSALAKNLPHGGIRHVSEASGLSRPAIYNGMRELEAEVSVVPGRQRKAGAGRKTLVSKDNTLEKDLRRLVSPHERGDPESPLLWTSKSLRKLSAELSASGHSVGHVTVGKLLEKMGYTLQSNKKSHEGGELWSAEDLAVEVFAAPDIEGITISGGEPFAQAAGLAAMLRLIRKARDLGVIIYIGFRLERLQKLACSDSGVAELLAVADLIIDGPYEETLNHDVSLKGSSNQRAHLLSSRYRDFLYLYDSEQARRVGVQIRLDERMFIGILSRRQLMWWQKEKDV